MSADLKPRWAPTSYDSEYDELNHVVCWCTREFCLCGKRVDGPIVDFRQEDECLVCLDLEVNGCPRCGE